MARPIPGMLRRRAGPWIIVEVPVQDIDVLYPRSRRFYTGDEKVPSSEHIEGAHEFTDQKLAQRTANKLMHYSRNTWAEVVPLPIAWALVHAGGAPWKPRSRTP